jgi:two-component system, cell cycle sensor histidine kinase and response regulator CckA
MAEIAGTDSRVILVADDDTIVRHLLVAVLRREGYVVLAAADAQEALRLSRDYHEGIDMLLTDFMMPGMDGLELYGRLREERPRIKVLVISGRTSDELCDSGKLPFLRKPFQSATLRLRVREILASKDGK